MKNEFQTSDFWTAATLMALGEGFIGICHSNGSRAVFSFRNSPSLKENIENYRQRKLLIEPQNLFIQTKLLKNRLYEKN